MIGKLTVWQKLRAIARRDYDHQKWTPKVGDHYTIDRADLELFRIVDVAIGPSDDMLVETWDGQQINVPGIDQPFHKQRVHVPKWLLEPQQEAGGMTDEQRKEFREHLNRASEIVRSWPAWMQSVLDEMTRRLAA